MLESDCFLNHTGGTDFAQTILLLFTKKVMQRNTELEKIHIAVLGRQNVGKSKLINSIFGQELCEVDDKPGTTKDSTGNAVELSPFGPVIIIDTAGIDSDDCFEAKRINETIKTISKADFAVLVLDAREELDKKEIDLITNLNKIQIPFIAAVNKIEFGINPYLLTELKALEVKHFEISCKENVGIDNLKKKLIHLLPADRESRFIKGLVNKGDVAFLVVPDDYTLSQNSVLKSQFELVHNAVRGIAVTMIVKKHELSQTLSQLINPPDLVIVEDDFLEQAESELPSKVSLTTYSLIQIKNKVNLTDQLKAINSISKLHDGAKLLIAEACNQHNSRYEVDKSRIKELLRRKTRKEFQVDISNGSGLPENISDYKLIIHCDGCLLSRKDMQSRFRQAALMGVPFVNYSVFISYMNGLLNRLITPFHEAASASYSTN